MKYFDCRKLFFGSFALWVIFFQNSFSLASEQRLSELLSNKPVVLDDFLPGLIWGVPREFAKQKQLKDELLDSINRNPQAIPSLSDFISSMPITGRVPLSIVDSDWLRVNPNHDPVILSEHTIQIPKRPKYVTLFSSSGKQCQQLHQPLMFSKDYLALCEPLTLKQVDWVWLVQPDGNVVRYGIASWNEQKQDEPAPGAWIWFAERDDVWGLQISGKLANFLATQGISPQLNFEQGVEQPRTSSPLLSRKTIDEIPPTANDWGCVGLLQTPTARMQPEGYGSFTVSRTYPYSHTNLFFQPIDWMEFGFRYTSISNMLYGPAIAGTQAYKDKSIDVKFGLIEESSKIPKISLGMRDIAGTGFFSGEYVVASKRAGEFDWSVGLGWGYSGARANLSNPLEVISSKFSKRQNEIGEGGNFALSSYFRGRTAAFGGVNYQTPWEKWILKLEYDGNDYQHEPNKSGIQQDSPMNLGAVYRAGKGLDISIGFERGNTLTLGITLHTDLKKLAVPKLDDPAPVPVFSNRPAKSMLGNTTAKDFEVQTGWRVKSMGVSGKSAVVAVDKSEAFYWNDRIDRANAVMHRDAAPEIEQFTYIHHVGGVGMVKHLTDREAWTKQMTQALPPSEQKEVMQVHDIESEDAPANSAQSIYLGDSNRYELEPGIAMRYNLGGPDGFILYQIFAEAKGKFEFRSDTWLQGSTQLALLDNYDKFEYTAPSNLPRVRTYIREYLTSSKVTMPNLQLSHVGKLGSNQYFSVYAGYLENMYAGFGGEWMYRTIGSPIALGLDLNQVRQRDFDQGFSLREYRVATGHATLYWDTGWKNILANLSAGRYLAGDSGVTFEMFRVFQNGLRIGGYFTKTNVSAEQFGEGSFDKAIYVSIPFDAMLTRSSNKVWQFLWKPLIRDGGAKLNREVQLYEMTRLLDKRTLQYRAAELGNEIPIPSKTPINWD